MYNVYEMTKDGNKKWFVESLGNDKFTAEVLFDHMSVNWLNAHHDTELILVKE